MAFILGCVHGWAAITAGCFREKNIHYLTIFLCDAKAYESKKQDNLLWLYVRENGRVVEQRG